MTPTNNPQPQPPPGFILNPAYAQWQQADAQWQQAAQAAQQVQASNQQKQQQFDAAVQLIKQDGVHGFRIDIEADSTIAPDENAEKQARTDFAAKFVPFMEQIVPFAQGNKAGATFAEQICLFVMRGFRVARPLEEATTAFFDALSQMPPAQPQGQQGGVDSPADLAVRNRQVTADMGKTQAQLQIAREKSAVEMAKLGQQTQTDSAKIAAQEAEARAKMVMDRERLADESRFRAQRGEALQAREAAGLS